MGGGDLNMKKSWHTGTFHNQERVWKKEKEALAERKKLQELQKELVQERAVQELQRLQEEAGGKKREERVDWMYAAPAEGNGPSAEELEQYLLGKKRVDKLLKDNQEQALTQGGAVETAGTFTSLQNANSARDTAAKIREDPLLAIKRQEQAQYEKMLKDPKRLRALREAKAGGATPSASGSGGKHGRDELKEERRARKEAKRAERDERHSSRRDGGDRERSSRRDDRSRSRSPRRSSHRDDDERRSHRDGGRDDRSREYRSSRDEPSRSSYGRDAPPSDRYDRRPEVSSSSYDRRPPSPRRDPGATPYSASSRPPSSYPSRPPPAHQSTSHSHSASSAAPAPPPVVDEAARRAAIESRLAAMQSSAASLQASRATRLTESEAQDAAQLAKEERDRASKGGVGPKFLSQAQGKVFGGMDLSERMRRSGKAGMGADRD